MSRTGIRPVGAKLLAFSGSFTAPIPLALNQEKGTCRVKVTAIISGGTQEVT